MAASRSTHVVHPDGTVSTRTSKTRTYTWAVEGKTDRRAEAADAIRQAEELERSLASFERAVAKGETRHESKNVGLGHTRHAVYAVDPVSGEGHRLGTQYVAPEDQGERAAFDRDAAISWRRSVYQERVEKARQKAKELRDGPAYEYWIIRWSEHRDSAEKAVASSARNHPHTTFRVVEAQEGKAPAPIKK